VEIILARAGKTVVLRDKPLILEGARRVWESTHLGSPQPSIGWDIIGGESVALWIDSGLRTSSGDTEATRQSCVPQGRWPDVHHRQETQSVGDGIGEMIVRVKLANQMVKKQLVSFDTRRREVTIQCDRFLANLRKSSFQSSQPQQKQWSSLQEITTAGLGKSAKVPYIH
jgi:hypothetical protein